MKKNKSTKTIVCDDPVSSGLNLYTKLYDLFCSETDKWEACDKHFLSASDLAILNLMINYYSFIGKATNPIALRNLINEHNKILIDEIDKNFPTQAPDNETQH